jgi:hypothetical protein
MIAPHLSAKQLNEANWSHVSQLFFSDKNVQALHEGIRYGVFKATGKVIDKQSNEVLIIVMRSMYLQFSVNLGYNVVQQVRDLNARVLDYCVPQVTNELKARLRYWVDSTQEGFASQINDVRPVNQNIKGHRSLEFQPRG